MPSQVLAQTKGFLWIETKHEKDQKVLVEKCHDASIYGKAQCDFTTNAAVKLAGTNASKVAAAKEAGKTCHSTVDLSELSCKKSGASAMQVSAIVTMAVAYALF